MKTLVPFSTHRCLPCYTLRKWKNTTLFQGHRKRNTYFEGWYFKMVSADGTAIFSVIPGLSLSRDGKEQHAFIQLINGVTAETHYFTFPIEAFAFSTKAFVLTIGPNYFSKERLVLDLKDEQTVVKAKVEMFNGVDFYALHRLHTLARQHLHRLSRLFLPR
jgi:hypothetical protein